MGMNLSIKRQTYGPAENQEWLGSSQGTQSMDSITLDAAACVAKFADGLVPSGIPLKRGGTGLYAPAVAAEVPDYHLFTTVDLTAGGTVPVGDAADTPASGFWGAGEVVVAKVPAYADRTTAMAAGSVVGLIKYV